LVVPVPLPVEEGSQDRGQLPSVGIEAGGGVLMDGGQQHRVLGDEPVQCPQVLRPRSGR